MQAALKQLDYKAPIIPDTTIKFIFVNSWDERFLDDDNFYLIDSGGYSAAKVYDVATTMNISGVLGEFYSSTTRFSAGVASQFKIPFCGHIQGSPALSDIRAYPYFFRMLFGKSFARQLVPFLRNYNVRKVSIVYFKNFIWESQDIALKAHLEQNTIQVVVNIPLSSVKDPSFAIHSLQRHKSQVIIALMAPEHIKPFYFAAARQGLVGPGHVWISANGLSNFRNDDDTKLYNYTYEERMRLGKGFIYVFSESDLNTYAFSHFAKYYWGIVGRYFDVAWEDTIGSLLYNGELQFDCLKALLIGMKTYLDDHPDLTPEDLGKEEYRKELSNEFFSKISFSGVSSQFIEFNREGELKMPFAFYIANETTLSEDNGDVYKTTKFGRTNADATVFNELRPPIFSDSE
ncbi:hypothetical protein HDU97_010424 [Phlyctochytrium planicorne]|nr:hypothetical protein HDU97_010424 [Phlyctochytrium planicorne]